MSDYSFFPLFTRMVIPLGTTGQIPGGLAKLSGDIPFGDKFARCILGVLFNDNPGTGDFDLVVDIL